VQNWYDRGYDIDAILGKGLEWHASVINAKSKPIPAPWRPKVDEFLKKLGYRLIIREIQHQSYAQPGDQFVITSRWENVGVAPIYHRWPLAYRLRSESDEVIALWTSEADPRQWLPGGLHEVRDTVMIPSGLPSGAYSLEVALLDRDGGSAHVALAIEGRRPDLWYEVSKIRVPDAK
jgi:hypothetical protein